MSRRYFPAEIRHALRKYFSFPEQSVYAQVATVLRGSPTIRTMRLYDLTSGGNFILFSHTKTKKWKDVHANSRVAVCLFDLRRKVQILATGRCIPHTKHSSRALIAHYWNILDRDDKKLYGGPVPGRRLHKKIQFNLPKNIPTTFGVMEVIPTFWELLEVSANYLVRSVRLQFVRTRRGWSKERVIVG